MPIVKIKGYEINTIIIKDSFQRRAVNFRNGIIKTLSKIGVPENDIDIPLNLIAGKKFPATVSWYVDGRHLYYSYSKSGKFVENLYVVHRVIEAHVNAFLKGEKAPDEFINEFHEEHDISNRRKEAREILGLEHDTADMDVIDKAYKNLAKEHHPDKATGNVEEFKKINHAHKTLKRELE